jgi:Uma2 family endonuclease
MSTTTSKSVELYFPESDGKPKGETDWHIDTILSLISVLKTHFRDDPQFYVAGDMFLYYDEEDSKNNCCPDIFIVRGVENHFRRTYKLWEEAKAPDLVIEVTSKSSRLEDRGNKKVTYAELGVTEYFIFDPLNEYLKPPLVGFRLEQGEYVQMEPSRGKFKSDVTGLELAIVDGKLRFIDPATGQLLRTHLEITLAQIQAEEERDLEAEARKAAQAALKELQANSAEEIARLQAELEKYKSSRADED